MPVRFSRKIRFSRSNDPCWRSLIGADALPTATTPMTMIGTVDAMIKERSRLELMVSAKLTTIMTGVSSAVRRMTFMKVKI